MAVTKRLVCVVEGKGEVEAVPLLCVRIFHFLGAWDWMVDQDPVRQPRGKLVTVDRQRGSGRCNEEGIRRAVDLARRRPADGVIVLCDADDDCAAAWGPVATTASTQVCASVAIMAVREYEAWLLLSFSDEERTAAHVRDPERIRDAKGEVRKLVPAYSPTTHQLDLTRKLDVARVRAQSDSFDKLVRSLAGLAGVTPPARL